MNDRVSLLITIAVYALATCVTLLDLFVWRALP